MSWSSGVCWQCGYNKANTLKVVYYPCTYQPWKARPYCSDCIPIVNNNSIMRRLHFKSPKQKEEWNKLCKYILL